MSLEVRVEGEDVSFEIRVLPRSQPQGLAGVRDGRLAVRVGAAPLDGKANQELRKVLARAFGVAPRAVDIIAGERSRKKRVRIRGLTVDQVQAVIQEASL